VEVKSGFLYEQTFHYRQYYVTVQPKILSPVIHAVKNISTNFASYSYLIWSWQCVQVRQMGGSHKNVRTRRYVDRDHRCNWGSQCI